MALGLTKAALFAGTSVGPLLGGVMGDYFDYRTAFYAASIMMTSAGLLAVTHLVNFEHSPSRHLT